MEDVRRFQINGFPAGRGVEQQSEQPTSTRLFDNVLLMLEGYASKIKGND